MIDLSYIALCAVLVPILRFRGHYGYSEAKEQALIALTYLHLAASLLLPGGRLPVPGGAAAGCLLGYLSFTTLSVAWSDNPRDSIRELPRWYALGYFFLVCSRSSLLFVAEAVVVPAAVVAVYGLLQQWWKCEPCWKELRNHQRAWEKGERLYSFLGNPNYTAAYLVPCFFAGLYLAAEHSPWWLLPLAPVWLAIGFSRCRAAWLAAIAGLVLLNFLLAPDFTRALYLVGGAIGFAVTALIAVQRVEPIVGRFFYIRACLRLFKQKPLFGWGPRVFRRRYFEEQARMNEEDPTILGTPDKPGRNVFPIGKRAHSDHFETLAEGGIFGYGLFAAFFVAILRQCADPVILAAIAAALVNALFFYNLRCAEMALPFFALCGCAAGFQISNFRFEISPLYAIPALLVLGYLVYRFAVVPFRAGLLFHDAHGCETKEGALRMASRALALEPESNMFLAFRAALLLPERPAEALLDSLRCLELNDGQKIAWQSWDQAGRAAYVNGAILLSQAAFRKAIRLNPAYLPAHEGLCAVGACLEEVRKMREAKP